MNPQKRRIRFVWNYLDWGGANVHMLAIMKQAACEWDIEVLLPVGSSQDILDMITAIGVRHRLIDSCLDKDPAPRIARKLQRQWRRIRAEFVTYRELNKDSIKDLVVHCELAPWQSWIFYWLLTRRGAKTFVTMHNALPDRPRWRNRVWRARLRLLSKARGFHILPSNQHAKEHIRNWVEPESWEAMPVTYTAVNPEEIDSALAAIIDRAELRRQYGVPEDAFVVLTVGRFIDRKGRWTLLEAARKVADQNDEIVFLWVTPSPPNHGELARVGTYGLGDRFRLIISRDLGHAHADVLSFYRIADAFALPSYVEGLPIALLEAMAMGLPTVSTNVFAVPEAVIDRETGLLIDAGDSDALATKVIELFGDSALREKLASQGRKHVLKNFDERVSARIAIAEYLKALDE